MALAETAVMLKHSVCRWCYPELTLDELCALAVSLGIESVELLKPDDVPTLAKHGLSCAMFAEPRGKLPGGNEVGGIESAWNRPEHHDALVEAYRDYLPTVAQAGGTRVICFSGNRDGLDDTVGLDHCAAGLRRLIPVAEELGITLVMELLNSKVDHRDYMGDHTAWGVRLCEAVGSDHFGLLYDIYHMQVMEGDLIATIRRDHPWIKHVHTAGVPGRHEINGRQEINYPAVIASLREVGYRGYIGHEFKPLGEPTAALRQAIEACASFGG